jgi:flagellar motor switch protein FliN/FliY
MIDRPPNGEEERIDGSASALEESSDRNGSAAPERTGAFQALSKFSATQTRNDIDMIRDIPLQMTVELGRTKIAIRDLLQLAQGSVVELDGLAGEPLDVLINGYLVAQGEVVMVNEKFGIRLTDIVTPAERVRKSSR